MTRSPCFSRSPLLPGAAHASRCESRARSLRGRFGIPLSQRTPRPGCWAAQEWFDLSCCKKAGLRRARLFPRRPKAAFRAYRGSIELASNATRIRSVAENSRARLRIFTENIQLIFGRAYRNSATSSPLNTRSAILRRRSLGQLLEHTIELRQRLKTNGESNFTDAQIRIPQEIASLFESGPCDVFDKIYAGYLLELFA